VTDRGPVIGAILSGGRSSRFGRDKALEPVGDRAMMEVVVEAFRSAGVDPVIAIGGSAGDTLGVPTVADRWPGLGPLGGVATALHWAKRGHVLVAPCDLPRLTADHVALLLAALDRTDTDDHTGRHRAVVAAVEGEPAHQLALWPAEWWPELRSVLDQGQRRFATMLDIGPWVSVEVPAEAVSDADDPTELKRLLADRNGKQ
jgi:molybdopterin-guanine dinucleotide biosynthesis protein A